MIITTFLMNLDYRGHMATMFRYETSAELFGGIC